MKTRTAVVYEHDAPVVVDTLTLDDPESTKSCCAWAPAAYVTPICRS